VIWRFITNRPTGRYDGGMLRHSELIYLSKLKNAPRYILASLFIVVGAVFVSGGARWAAGDMGHAEPIAGLLLAAFSLQLVLASYAFVKSLPGEIGFRTAIYLVILFSIASLFTAIATLVRYGIAGFKAESAIEFFHIGLGLVATGDFLVLFKWAGLDNTPRSQTKPISDLSRNRPEPPRNAL
jgi:drug/metabolite transporter (DMT)-like permease